MNASCSSAETSRVRLPFSLTMGGVRLAGAEPSLVLPSAVYKIPPRPSLEGWKAQDWGENSFIWEGRLRVVESGNKAVLKLEVGPLLPPPPLPLEAHSSPSEIFGLILCLVASDLKDANTGELFATSPYDPPGTNVEPVLDSSRYFAVRVVNEQGGKATIGMGYVNASLLFSFA